MILTSRFGVAAY